MKSKSKYDIIEDSKKVYDDEKTVNEVFNMMLKRAGACATTMLNGMKKRKKKTEEIMEEYKDACAHLYEMTDETVPNDRQDSNILKYALKIVTGRDSRDNETNKNKKEPFVPWSQDNSVKETKGVKFMVEFVKELLGGGTHAAMSEKNAKPSEGALDVSAGEWILAMCIINDHPGRGSKLNSSMAKKRKKTYFRAISLGLGSNEDGRKAYSEFESAFENAVKQSSGKNAKEAVKQVKEFGTFMARLNDEVKKKAEKELGEIT